MDFDSLTLEDLRAALAARKIDFPSIASKKDLMDIIQNNLRLFLAPPKQESDVAGPSAGDPLIGSAPTLGASPSAPDSTSAFVRDLWENPVRDILPLLSASILRYKGASLPSDKRKEMVDLFASVALSEIPETAALSKSDQIRFSDVDRSTEALLYRLARRFQDVFRASIITLDMLLQDWADLDSGYAEAVATTVMLLQDLADTFNGERIKNWSRHTKAGLIEQVGSAPDLLSLSVRELVNHRISSAKMYSDPNRGRGRGRGRGGSIRGRGGKQKEADHPASSGLDQ